MKHFKTYLLIVLLIFFAGGVYGQYEYPFQNPDLSIEKRIDSLLSSMKLDEKIECLDTDPDVPRLGIEATGHVKGLHGLDFGDSANRPPTSPIPSTQFPQAIGMAKTWNSQLMKKAGKLEGHEARYIYQIDEYNEGGLIIRAPNASLGRNIRWRRSKECYGEDPYFSGKMIEAFVKGLQGPDSKYWQTASLMKYSQVDTNEAPSKDTSSKFGERLFREYYAAPLRMGIENGGSKAYMATYNGIPCSVHPVMKDITREEWGHNGIICTDTGALHNMVTAHNDYKNVPMAAAASIKSGINQFTDGYRDSIQKALDKNILKESDIDKVLRGSFRVMIRLGLLDSTKNVPYADIGSKNTTKPWKTEKHKNIAAQITRESIVLLKNENNILPLYKNTLNSVAVVGPRSNEVLTDGGIPPYKITAIEGIQKKTRDRTKVLHASDTTTNVMVEKARNADMAIVCVGNHPACDAGWEECPNPGKGKEAADRRSIKLEQEALIKKIYNANPNTIVVLMSSFPYAITWTDHNVPAILQITHGSQEIGNALADVLFGDYNPGGRLVRTWPRSESQLPPIFDYNIRNGATYRYFEGNPLYPFGYGLSYTDFTYSNLNINKQKITKNDEISVSVEIKNTGKRKGDEVAQLYVKHLNSGVKRPEKELKGFQRITLNPGEKNIVSFQLQAETLEYWNTNTDGFTLEDNTVKLMVGRSSENIKFSRKIPVKN